MSDTDDGDTDDGDTDDGDTDEPGLGLDEVLAALRHDLTAARDDVADEGYGLGVAEVEIELSVEVSRSRSGEGGVGAKWFVLSGDVSGRASRDRTDAHRIRLTLRPTGPGEPEQVADPVSGVGQSSAADPIGAPIADSGEGLSGG